MPVVDANVFVSIYWNKDAHHTESRAWLDRYLHATYPLDPPYLILSEVAGAVARRTGDSALGHAALAQLQQVPRLTLQPVRPSMWELAARLAADLRLRGPDAVYAATAVYLGTSLITWDEELHTRTAAHIQTHYPPEL